MKLLVFGGIGARLVRIDCDDPDCYDHAFLLREQDGSVHVEHDRHRIGLFPRAVWIETLWWGLDLFLGRAPEHA